ncbi:MAG: glycosyltransferase [Anaerolineae bacterium]
MKIAIVVSWLNQYGGAERVLEAAHELFPDAPVYTSIYDPAALPAEYRRWDIRVSFLDRLPGVHRHHQRYLPLYPLAFAGMRLKGYDLVLSIPSAFAHGVQVAPPTPHLCYCLTPARFLWQHREYVENEAVGRAVRALLPLAVKPLRAWDRQAARRVTRFIAISSVVQTRIQNYYGRPSTIIYPPVDVARFQPVPSAEVGDYYLIVSRLVPYKRVHLAVEAFTRLGLPLVIAGDGRDRARLEKMAGPTIRFMGRVSDAERRDLMARCRALIFPGEEDFGLTPLEANASGRPVIAYAGGGALDSICEGVNGVLFAQPDADSLADCVQTFNAGAFDPQRIRVHAETFDVQVFKQALCDSINQLVKIS